MSVSEDMYRLIPCLNGVCASPSSEVTRSIRDAKSTKGVEGVVLLPGGIAHDLLMTDETLAYPKFKDDALAYPSSVSLSEEDILNLDCSNANNFSFTVYGPGSQDKNNNQDFALSGHFSDNDGHVSRFVILADGISNGFAFPQRGAQLSCLAAYQCLKELHNEFEGSNRRLNEEDVATFREHLAQKINDLLEEDHQHLLTYFDSHHQEPPHIASKVWHKSFKEKPEKWYGNTLLVSFLSPFGAFIVYAGDGGIVLLKGSSDPKDVIRSDASSAISRFVTLDVTRATFLGALITYDENDDFIEVIMATDGVDRTYQLNGMDLTTAFSEEASLDDLVDQIANLKERVSGEVDVDNYSIGRVFLPLSDKKHSRLVGEAASPTAFAPTPKSAIGMEGENEKSAAPTTHITTKNADVELQQKKKGGSMKLPLSPVLLGIAIGLGLSNALVIGLSKMNITAATPPALTQADIAGAEAAAMIAAQKADQLAALNIRFLELSEKTSDILAKATQTEAEATAAQQEAQAAADKAAELTAAAETAQTTATQAQADATTAQQEAQAAADKAAELTAAAETAQTTAEEDPNFAVSAQQAQADATAAQQGAQAAADKAAELTAAAETAQTTATQAQADATAAQQEAQAAADKAAALTAAAMQLQAQAEAAQAEATAAQNLVNEAAQQASEIARQAATAAANAVQSIPEKE